MKTLVLFSLVFFAKVHSSDSGSISRSPSIGNSGVTTPEKFRLNKKNLQKLQNWLEEDFMIAKLIEIYEKLTDQERLEIDSKQTLSFLKKGKVAEYKKRLINLFWFRSVVVIEQGFDDARLQEIFEKQVKAMEVIDHRCCDETWRSISLRDRATYNITKNRAYEQAYELGHKFQAIYLNCTNA